MRTCAVTYFEGFVRNPLLHCSVAMLCLASGQTWRPVFRIFARNITCDFLTGWSCSDDWRVIFSLGQNMAGSLRDFRSDLFWLALVARVTGCPEPCLESTLPMKTYGVIQVQTRLIFWNRLYQTGRRGSVVERRTGDRKAAGSIPRKEKFFVVVVCLELTF